MNNKQTIEISTATIFKVIAVILGLVLVYLVKNVLVMLFLAIIIAAAADMPIDWLVKHKVRRGFAVAIVYILAILIFASIIYLIIPPLAEQIKNLAVNLPDYLFELENRLAGAGTFFSDQNLQDLLSGLADKLSASAGDIIAATINIFGGIMSAFIVLVISIYLAAREQGVKKFVLNFFAPSQHDYVASLVDRILYKLGAWLRGQIVLMAVIGLMVFIGLSLLRVKFALTLALVAALFEIFPIIGPIIAAVPAIIFALLQSPGLAILTAAMYYVVQELEKYLVVPLVMKKAVGLSSISILIAVVIGAELYGIIGALLAIPVAAMISIGFNDLMERRKSIT